MIKTLKSELLDDEYRLLVERKELYISSDQSEDEGDPHNTQAYDHCSTLLYKSRNSYIYLSNRTFEEEQPADPYELVADCFLKDTPDVYIRDELYDAILELNEKSGSILKIYQFFDDTVNFVFIEDSDFFGKLDENGNDVTSLTDKIDDYISTAKNNSNDDHGWICSRIAKGKYEKYANE